MVNDAGSWQPGLVACGASLGGLDALQILLSVTPEQLRAPILVAQHRRAGMGSHLRELLQRRSGRDVVEPEDQEPLRPGCVYLAPPDYHLMVQGGCCELSQDAQVNYSRPSIDVLFESVADAYGPDAVAIVLTGSSDDGARGAARIKAVGGILIVQDPHDAESPVLVQATLRCAKPDYVSRVAEMGDVLVDVLRRRTQRRPSRPRTSS